MHTEDQDVCVKMSDLFFMVRIMERTLQRDLTKEMLRFANLREREKNCRFVIVCISSVVIYICCLQFTDYFYTFIL